MDKSVSPAFLAIVARHLRLVFANGCFDGAPHQGHRHLLSTARTFGDALVVALNSDDSVRALKGPTRPLQPLEVRMTNIAALPCVDYVVSFDTLTPLDLIRQVMPYCVCKGGDYRAEDVAGYGIVPIVIVPTLPGFSTTALYSGPTSAAIP
jgi:D-beta-D-heptose 7-phosphate kinase/D-beta-D-heptose 1-phosphate adenosyltransferase